MGTYVSPVKIFNAKAKKVCPEFRRAYGYNAKLNACLDCSRKTCLVEDD